MSEEVTKIPDFLIVGAAKSGTSSLHSYLSKHPDIYMPERRKELYFWHAASNDNLSIVEHLGKDKVPVTLSDYLSYFENASEGQITGEACHSYLYFHNHVAANLKKYHDNWKDTKIIIILREPVSRVVSQYKFVCKHNLDPDFLNFKRSLEAEEGRLHENKVLPDLFYVDGSKYADKVAFFKNNFANVHVCLYDDLKERPRQLLSELCDFIGVESERLPEFDFDVVNSSDGAKRVKYPLLGRMAHGVGRIVLAWLPVSWKKRLSRILKSLISEPVEITAPELDYLQKIFRPEIDRLEKVLERDLSRWKRKEGE